tara:strand:+ start:705 stop:1022 length:318 start_codon:yes stop_codon:yes gene_type:complete
VEIKTRKLFKELVKKLTLELLDEESLEEMTSTGNVAGYSTPKAFSKKKKKKKSGYDGGHKKPDVFEFDVVSEAIDEKDFKVITKLIRNVVGDILRDIWLKRNAWK